MNDDFATAMRRSLALTRAGNPSEATRQIQQALGQGGGKPATSANVRPSFGKTINDLAARSRPAFKGAGTVKADLPVGARFERRQFNGRAGGRAYHLYIPSCGADAVRGLVVMLHGCTQSPEDFANGTRMNAQGEAQNMLIAYPEQTGTHNANKCWNWFEKAHQQATSGEPAILAGLATELATQFGLGEGATFAAGLSAGGAMAALLGALHRDVFGAVGVHSGLPVNAAQDVMSAFAAMRGDGGAQGSALGSPGIVFQGLADSTVAPVNAGRLTGTILLAERDTLQVQDRRVQRTTGQTGDGHDIELWLIEGAGHAWSGGSPDGSYADPKGPDASAQMMRFFTQQMDKRS